MDALDQVIIDNDTGAVIVELQDGDVIVAHECGVPEHEPDECGVIFCND